MFILKEIQKNIYIYIYALIVTEELSHIIIMRNELLKLLETELFCPVKYKSIFATVVALALGLLKS